jgi:hypothetical protein
MKRMYPERKPIYKTYKKLVLEIIDSKNYKEYAESEIKALNEELYRTFNEIGASLLENNKWENK